MIQVAWQMYLHQRYHYFAINYMQVLNHFNTQQIYEW